MTESLFGLSNWRSSFLGNIQIHTNKYVSSTKANLQDPSQVVTSAEEFPAIVKAHGEYILTDGIHLIHIRASHQCCCGPDDTDLLQVAWC